MKIALIVIGNNVSTDLLCLLFPASSLLIGADKGAAFLAEHGFHMDFAVGDFDSVNETQLALIRKMAKQIVTLNPIKDDTDTEHALGLAEGMERILIVGGIQGKRIEHFLANVALLRRDSRIAIIDDSSVMMTLGVGEHDFAPYKTYTFFSEFALEPSVVSLQGFHYDAIDLQLMPEDVIGVSNQMKAEHPLLTIKSGRILAIFSKRD